MEERGGIEENFAKLIGKLRVLETMPVDSQFPDLGFERLSRQSQFRSGACRTRDPATRLTQGVSIIAFSRSARSVANGIVGAVGLGDAGASGSS